MLMDTFVLNAEKQKYLTAGESILNRYYLENVCI